MLQLDLLALTTALMVAFQRAPTLGGECYLLEINVRVANLPGFNGHPPLGVNATVHYETIPDHYYNGFNGHPPLGVNATRGHGLGRR